MGQRPNRRKSVRYASISNRAWLAWRAGGESAQAPARVRDISQSGASVLVEHAPSLNENDTAWVRMEHPAPSDWVEVKVVGIAPVTRKPFLGRTQVLAHLVRVEFVDSCPYEVFKTATHGDQLNGSYEERGPSDSDRVIWR
jgi:hypothetical protein